MDTGGHSGSPAEPKVRKRDGKRWIPTLSAPHRIFTRRRSLVRVQQSPPRENLGITMVPRFFLCLFLEEKSLSACGILGYFRVISGLLVAKVLQIFSALYPLCHKGLRLFRQGRLLQIFLDGFLAECPTDLLSSLLLPIFTIIVGINTQRHVHRAVSSQILNLLYVQSSFKKTCDVSVAENMGS